MSSFRRTIGIAIAFVLCLVFSAQLRAQSAQSSIDPAHLPKNTVFYVLWRGAPSSTARSANSLYALWDDPGFAPARNALFDSFMSDSRKSADVKSQLTREELSEYTTLLENPMALGFVAEPEDKSKSVSPKTPSTSNSASPKTESAHKWNGYFFVYDRSGKEALLAKALLRMRATQKDPPKMTSIMIAGLPALKMEHKTESDYWLETGKYVISSGEPSVIEQILRGTKAGASLLSSSDVAALDKALRNTKTTVPPSPFLGGVSAFKEANPVLGNGILEFFVNLSEAIKLAGDNPGPQGIRPSMILDSLKISSVHSFSGRVFLDGAKTRFQGGILGDATSGTVFDIWDAGQAKPASIAYISPGTVSYRETQLNLPAVYALILRLAKPYFPKGQGDQTDMIEAAAQMKLGMSISDTLNSLTGEFGSMDSGTSFEPGKSTYFVGVRNRDSVLKLLRRAFIDNIAADVDEGGVTYITLDMSSPRAGQKPEASPKFYLAVAKDIIFLSGNRESLRSPLAQGASSQPPAQLAPFFASHNGGQNAVNGLSFTDLQKFDWNSLRNLPGRNKATGTSAVMGFAPDKTAPPKEKSWLEEIDPKVFRNHLHLGLGYSWKDTSGLHFDGWID